MAPHGRRLALVVLVLTVVSVRPAESQSPPPWPAAPPPDGLLVQIGLEPHLVVSMAYLWSVARDEPNIGVGAGVKVAPYLLGDGAGRLNLIVAGQWQADGHLGATGTAQLYAVRSRNRAATAHGFGMELRLAPGRHGERWAFAADLGWQGTLLTHIRHGHAAKQTFEERHPDEAQTADGPVDGWYGSTSHRFRVGILTTRSVGDGLGIQVSAGSRFSLQRQGILIGFAHGQVPVYLEASLRWAR